MSLFQNNVTKKYTHTLDKKKLDEKWHLFTTIFHNTAKQDNIRNSKEEQYQEGFLRDLFVQILGYTLNPDAHYNLISEQKNETNSKKADGAIILNENVHAVIELKGTETTDLAKIENQAFGYKNNQKNCSYVIISNFEKLRFYIDNATEHIEFNLFTLSRAEFDLLYTCLSLESMQTDLPKKIKNESVSNEDKITAALYKDYSAFRKELFTDIEQLNPQYDRLLLFKKTQKLLDRFLFIFFAEDRQLLPTNLIFSINLEWQKLREARVPVSLYDRYKMYFQDLNTGARVSLPAFGKHTNEIVTAQYDIYAYNGGLFQPDDVLDTIAINDDLLFKHTKKLSEYDFESEVDVNILGHIFENSLNEIDEITNAIEGQEVDKTKTKRKKDGVFYTPKYITKYIVDNTIGKLCEEKKTELALDETKYTTDKRLTVATKKKLIETLDSYRKWLLQLTIVDPACGSGAFLNQALEFLIAEHRYVDELQAKLFGDALVLSDVEGSILENNLFGVDLNEESVEIAKLSLWLRTAQRNRKLNSLNNNIKCGNSLIDDATIAGDKAFNWQNEFPQVFEKGGFDVVIGNPPYVSTKEMHKNGMQNQIECWNRTFESSKSGNYDLYILFVEQGLKILKKNNYLSYIIPNKFLIGKYSESILNMIYKEFSFEKVIDYSNVNVFADASVYPVIITIKKISTNSKIVDRLIVEKGSYEEFSVIRKWNYIDLKYQDKLNVEVDSIIEKIEKSKNLINSKLSFEPGINGFQFTNYSVCVTDGKISDNSKKLTVTGNIDPYIFLNNTTRYKKVDYSEPFIRYEKDIISDGKWELFCKPKIMVAGMTKRIEASLDLNGDYAPSVSVYSICGEKNVLKNVILLLNSKLINWFFLYKFSDKHLAGGYISINNLMLKKIPLKKIDKENDYAILANELRLNFQTITQKFSKYFSGQFKLDKLSGKLEKWYELSFEEFIKEINKAIKAQKGTPLTKKDEFDWIDLFEENKQKANALQTQIATTDKAIDAMVYELYGLSEEEIKIVEQS